MPASMPRLVPKLSGALPRIRRQGVRSSSVREAGYDPQTATLDIQFTGGGLYRYHDVPPEVHAALVQADSPGRFVNERVRGHFRCYRIG